MSDSAATIINIEWLNSKVGSASLYKTYLGIQSCVIDLSAHTKIYIKTGSTFPLTVQDSIVLYYLVHYLAEVTFMLVKYGTCSCY